MVATVSDQSGASTPRIARSGTPAATVAGIPVVARRARRCTRAQCSRSDVRRVVLHVEIRAVGRRHDHLGALRHRLRRRRRPAASAGRWSVGSSAAGAISSQPIICLPCGLHDRLHALDERDVLRRRQRLHLVAADVEVRAGRQRRDLAHHVVDELVGDVLVDAERAEADLDAGVAAAGATPSQFSSAYDASAALVWPGMSISGTIVMKRSRAYATSPRTAPACRSRPGRRRPRVLPAVRREVRPRLDLDPPALIVGEVQVQAVQLVAAPSDRCSASRRRRRRSGARRRASRRATRSAGVDDADGARDARGRDVSARAASCSTNGGSSCRSVCTP